jgi:hypothetical protein
MITSSGENRSLLIYIDQRQLQRKKSGRPLVTSSPPSMELLSVASIVQEERTE